MRKNILNPYSLILTACLFLTPATLHAKKSGTSYVDEWISAMMNSGKGLNSIITPDFEYTGYSFDFKNRIYRAKKGDVPFFEKVSKPDEINVEDVRPVSGGTIVILNSTASSGLYREWETRLFIEPGGISKVSEIAIEGKFEGEPPGCPETSFKRDSVVTLSGTPEGFIGRKEVKLYNFSRDTDLWDFAHPGVDEKMFKYCSPRPDTFTIESEVVVFDEKAQIETADTVAAKHKGEKDETARGTAFFEEDGVNFPGRLFRLENGKEGLLLTFTTENDKGGKREIVNPAKLFVRSGNGWKSIWGFDAGFSETSGSMDDVTGGIEWSIKSAADSNSRPAISATLEANQDRKFNCPAGTQILFTKSGSGFKPGKSGVPGACFKKHSVSDGALRAHAKEDKGRTYHGDVQELDWMFQR